ncbi:MAG: hypothetical protein AAB510_00225 [Patescibacteria group bacterium]
MTEFGDNLEHIIANYWHYILALIAIFFLWYYDLLRGAIEAALALAGVIILGRMAWKVWVHYVQQDFISGIDYVLLEIIPPREVLRNPKAMELFFSNALYHWSLKGGKEEYWQGAVWFWFSLEIASIDGQVHFYVRTPTRIRGLIETQMYAQYPQAQVKEVEDYTMAVDKISPDSKWMGWGCEFKLKKNEAYPIKTYVDFGLDKDPKEEYKVDPISPLIELFGSLKKGEQMWVQIVVTPSKKAYKTKGTLFGSHDWVQEAQDEVLRFLAPYTSHKEVKEIGDYGIGRSRIETRVPPFLDRAVKAMGAKTTKLGFDTGIRAYYVAPKEIYDMSSRRNIRLIFRQYDAPDSNGLIRTNPTQADALGRFGVFSLSAEQVMVLADRMLNEYRERQFFHPPLRHQILNNHNIKWPFNIFVHPFFLPYLHGSTFVLNTEELATLWHFPGQILKVPTLERIESKEASPPTNLPT